MNKKSMNIPDEYILKNSKTEFEDKKKRVNKKILEYTCGGSKYIYNLLYMDDEFYKMYDEKIPDYYSLYKK